MRLIDADAVIEVQMYDEEHDAFYTEKMTVEDYICRYSEMPSTIDAEPIRHGKWLYVNEFHWYTASCNKCGYKRSTDIKAHQWNQWKFCPMCGSRMDEE